MDYGTIAVKEPEDRASLQMHDLRDPDAQHDDLQASTCRCRTKGEIDWPADGKPQGFTHVVRVQPFNNGNHALFVRPDGSLDDPLVGTLAPKPRTTVADGPPCLGCGDLTFRSGSCYSCHTCGSTTGCG